MKSRLEKVNEKLTLRCPRCESSAKILHHDSYGDVLICRNRYCQHAWEVTTITNWKTAEERVLSVIARSRWPLEFQQVKERIQLEVAHLGRILKKLVRKGKIETVDGKYYLQCDEKERMERLAETRQNLIQKFSRDRSSSSKNRSADQTTLKTRSRDGERTKSSFPITSTEEASEYRLLKDMENSSAYNHLIWSAREEIVVISPFIQETVLVKDLIRRAREGIKITVIMRRPFEQFSRESKKKHHGHVTNSLQLVEHLTNNNIMIYFNPSVHAKALIVDQSITVVTSMNLTKESVSNSH